tara:strand:+ start:1693 stop:2469 length:777 start_codon:yes stop_codon:yes gene_type:complete
MSNIKKFRIKSFKKQQSIIKFRKISISFGKRIVLDQINFNINQGEIFGMLGPNGVGKSTIFNLITGLIKPDSGNVIIENSDVTELPISLRTTKFGIGYCPQYSGYFHNLTVLDNLNAVGEILIKDKKDRKSKIDELIGDFELENTLDLKAKNLSGGQKKKLAISLSLIGNPKILLLDEPFAALDILSISNLQQIIVGLQTRSNITVVVCDHQARDLLSCVDVAIVLSNAKVLTKGTPSEITNDELAKSHYFGQKFKIN